MTDAREHGAVPMGAGTVGNALLRFVEDASERGVCVRCAGEGLVARVARIRVGSTVVGHTSAVRCPMCRVTGNLSPRVAGVVTAVLFRMRVGYERLELEARALKAKERMSEVELLHLEGLEAEAKALAALAVQVENKLESCGRVLDSASIEQYRKRRKRKAKR